MKKNLIFILAFFFITNLYGQDVSVELSIEWRMEKLNIYSEPKPYQTPYLKIRYNNLTDDSIYLVKAYRQGKPSFPIAFLGHRYCDEDINYLIKIAETHIKKNVVIRRGMWDVLPDSIDPNEETTVDLINDVLTHIYDDILNVANTFDLDMDNLIEDYIGKDLKNVFVFLLPNESHSDYFSLAGFKIIGGSYTFLLDTKENDDNNIYIHMPPTWSKQKQTWVYREINLPDKIKSYKLYKGDFYTNEVSISF